MTWGNAVLSTLIVSSYFAKNLHSPEFTIIERKQVDPECSWGDPQAPTQLRPQAALLAGRGRGAKRAFGCYQPPLAGEDKLVFFLQTISPRIKKKQPSTLKESGASWQDKSGLSIGLFTKGYLESKCNSGFGGIKWPWWALQEIMWNSLITTY